MSTETWVNTLRTRKRKKRSQAFWLRRKTHSDNIQIQKLKGFLSKKEMSGPGVVFARSPSIIYWEREIKVKQSSIYEIRKQKSGGN